MFINNVRFVNKYRKPDNQDRNRLENIFQLKVVGQGTGDGTGRVGERPGFRDKTKEK